MPYNSAPPAHLELMYYEDLLDWKEAPAGEWFIGVIDTETGRVCIAPTDIQDTEGVATNAGDRNDRDGLNRFRRRNMNRYASGGGSDDMLRYRVFSIGFDPSSRSTPHESLCAFRQLPRYNCVGFTLIKLAPTGFAQVKFGSNSMHNHLLASNGAHFAMSFSARTFENRNDYFTGSAQMPPVWRDALTDWLRYPPFSLHSLAASLD